MKPKLFRAAVWFMLVGVHAAALLLLTGCSTVYYTSPSGEKLKRVTFMNNTQVGGVSITLKDGTRIELTNYGNDQVSGAERLMEATARGLASGVKP